MRHTFEAKGLPERSAIDILESSVVICIRRRHSTSGWIHDEAVTKSRGAMMILAAEQPALNSDNYDDNLMYNL